MLVSGEENTVDGAPGPLHARTRPGTGDHDDVPRGNADHQFAGHRPLQVVPELVDQEHAGFKAVEREHQDRRLTVDTHPVQGRRQVLHRDAPQSPPGHPHPVEIHPGDQPLIGRAEGIGDADVVAELVEQVLRPDLSIGGRHQDRQKCGARHLHAWKPSIYMPGGTSPTSHQHPHAVPFSGIERP